MNKDFALNINLRVGLFVQQPGSYIASVIRLTAERFNHCKLTCFDEILLIDVIANLIKMWYISIFEYQIYMYVQVSRRLLVSRDPPHTEAAVLTLPSTAQVGTTLYHFVSGGSEYIPVESTKYGLIFPANTSHKKHS